MGNHPAATADPIGCGGIGEIHHIQEKANFASLNPALANCHRPKNKHLPGIILLCSPVKQDWGNGILDDYRQFFHYEVNIA
jgi:hypothetical protein